jgi:hypothetical protein
MAVYTSTDLLAAIRRRGSIPSTSNSSNVNSTANLLNLATEELHNTLLPLLMSTREEWYVWPTSTSIVANTAVYQIPDRAAGQVLRDVQIQSGSVIKSLTRIDVEDIETTATGEPLFYYLQANKVVLYPTPSSAGDTLLLKIFLRPSRLAATSDCVQITNVDTGTNTVTVAAVPSSWTTSTELDFIDLDSPHAPLSIDVNPTTVTGTTLIFSELPTGLAVGDWIAPADYTPIPQVPFEFQSVLAQMTVVRALEAIGDREGSKQAYANLQSLQQNMLTLITPRNIGSRKVIRGRNWNRR